VSHLSPLRTDFPVPRLHIAHLRHEFNIFLTLVMHNGI